MISLIRSAVEQGVTFFDTAEVKRLLEAAKAEVGRLVLKTSAA
jgi:aryl-alcohol dehydrogenase-like predicted oxidoreductase